MVGLEGGGKRKPCNLPQLQGVLWFDIALAIFTWLTLEGEQKKKIAVKWRFPTKPQ